MRGTSARSLLRCAGLFGFSFVVIHPGAMALTRIPCRARLRASSPVNMRTAALLAL
jgi:hypothetical protein